MQTPSKKAPPRLFWIAPRWPLPADDGARRATVYLLKSLAKLCPEIHLCSIVPEGEMPDVAAAQRELGLKRVTVITRKPSRHLVSLIKGPFTPITISPFATADVARQISRALGEWGDSEVVFDGLHASAWLRNLPTDSRGRLRKVYRAHNIESNLWVQGARQKNTNPAKSLFLSYQARLVSNLEKKLCRESRLVAAGSPDDAAGFEKIYGPVRAMTTPIGVPLARGEELAFPDKRRLLFIGRLDWQPNRDGLRWFLDNVWPKAAADASDLELVIAGAGDGRWLEAYSNLPRARILGRVPEVAPLYLSSAASLVPVFFGSGTRVKAIEASSYARPCISTAIGVEGIGLDERTSYFRAETADEWLQAILSLSLDEAKKRGEAAYTKIAEDFDPDRIASRLLEAMAASPTRG